jgi:Na+-transporting NADH:ubiquinone oxidoreductase subunit D
VSSIEISKKSAFKSKAFAVFTENLWSNNAIFVMVLGLCSSLAVTTSMANALVMGISVTIAVAASSAIIALIRKLIPENVRMIAFMLVISAFVISIDFALKIYVPDISKALGPYVGLIITNCILMGRAEAFAIKNPVGLSILDSLGAGLGYTAVILLISLVRELLSSASVFGIKLVHGWTSFELAGIAPGAFFVLGTLMIFSNMVKNYMKKKNASKGERR